MDNSNSRKIELAKSIEKIEETIGHIEKKVQKELESNPNCTEVALFSDVEASVIRVIEEFCPTIFSTGTLKGWKLTARCESFVGHQDKMPAYYLTRTGDKR